jgi:hypothetical protein
MPGYITARRPADVAREVKVLLDGGCRKFVVSRLAGGDMLDLERLGAARYTAGLHSVVELEEAPVPESSRAAEPVAR